MREILQYPHVDLMTSCKEVKEFDSELREISKEMWRLISSIEGVSGMGLAANQIGVLKRIFIVKCLDGTQMTFVNPIWEADDDERALEEEGCLSTPHLYDFISTRYQNITLKAQHLSGAKFEVSAYGVEAVCVQHECDHLDGVFWFDRMPKNVRKHMINKWEKMKK